MLETSTAPHPTVLRAFTSSHRAPKPKVLPRTGVRIRPDEPRCGRADRGDGEPRLAREPMDGCQVALLA